MATNARHGTRTRFNAGCTDGPDGTACDLCKQANRDYFKKRQQDKNAEKAGLDKPADKPAPRLIGPIEQGVIDLMAMNPKAVEARPDLAEAAKAMARLQDNLLYAAQATNANAKMRETITELLRGTAKKGKLASVSQMTQPSTATG